MRTLCLLVLLASCAPVVEGEPNSEVNEAVATPAAPAAVGAIGEHRAFRVMTYNVRGPFDTGSHTWDNRRAHVIGRVTANGPDVVGFQEAMHEAGEDMPTDLINGLHGSYDAYRGPGNSPKLILFKRSRFALVSGGSAALPNPYPSSHVCFDRAGGKRITWAKLRDLTSNREYFIGDTHLAFSAECGSGRLAQAREIKRVIDAEADNLPVIVMGDFNTDPQSLADEGVIDAMETYGDRTLYRTARVDGTVDADTATFNSRWNGSGTNNHRLDYIFHSGKEISSSSPSIDHWPNTDTGTPSDHFPVLATIRAAVFEPGSTLIDTPAGDDPKTQLFFADLDGDGCADQISWNAGVSKGSTFWAKSRCNGTFSAPVEHTSGWSSVDSTRFFFADLTGDGCADKVYWRPTAFDGQLRIYRSKCNGSFDPVVQVTTGSSESENTHFYFARINADACADLIRWNPGQASGHFRVYLTKCDGAVHFGAAIESGDSGHSESAGTQAWFADVDGDGRADKILWNPQSNGGRTRVYRAETNGTFTKSFEHAAGTSGVSTSRFFFADVTGDGKADKIFWRPEFREGRMQIYPSSGDDFAAAPAMDNPGYSNSENTDFFFADVDHSGAADKVYWNAAAYGGSARVYRSRQ